MEVLAKLGAGWIVGIIMIVVRLIESILQLKETPEAKTIIDKLVQLAKNFFLDLETYKKPTK